MSATVPLLLIFGAGIMLGSSMSSNFDCPPVTLQLVQTEYLVANSDSGEAIEWIHEFKVNVDKCQEESMND